MADLLLAKRDTPLVGKNWMSKFIKCHIEIRKISVLNTTVRGLHAKKRLLLESGFGSYEIWLEDKVFLTRIRNHSNSLKS